jgi:hypothetical protein
MAIPTPRRTAALPLVALTELARTLRAEAGARVSTLALQNAGYRAGDGIYREFAGEVAGGDPAALSRDRFWQELARFFDRRGWGRLREVRIHPGMGLLTAYEWAESAGAPTGAAGATAGPEEAPVDDGGGSERNRSEPEGVGAPGTASSGCPFSTGMFARILGEAAGGPVAVLQVACTTRGDEACQFLFGHEDAVHRSYGLLTDGTPLDRVLEQV